MNNDLISREALKKAIEQYQIQWNKNCETDIAKWDSCESILAIINHAPTVDIKDQIAGAYNEGYMCGNKEAEKARSQDERVDISKLRLMKVEECAGHTIDYAMGWKACIESIYRLTDETRKWREERK